MIVCLLVVPCTAHAGEFVPAECWRGPITVSCKDAVHKTLGSVADYLGGTQVHHRVPLLDKHMSIPALCTKGVNTLSAIESDVVILWKYFLGRRRDWSDRMRTAIVTAARRQVTRKASTRTPISDDEALRYVTDHLPGAAARTKCSWKVSVFGGIGNALAGNPLGEIQASAPLVVADMARLIQADVARGEDPRDVSVGLVFLSLVEALHR